MQNIVYEANGNIYINLTNMCDNNCAFCIRNHADDVNGYYLWLDKDPTAKEIIDELQNWDLSKYNEVVFCGFGEPTYRIDVIVEVAKFVHSKGSNTRINTNGHGNIINGYDITQLIVDNIDTINVSLNEVDEDKYQEICKCSFGEIAYSEMIDFAKKCIAKGGDVVFSVVDVIPKESIEKAAKIAKDIGARLRVRELS